MQRSPNTMRNLAHSNIPIEKWNELFSAILGSSSVPKDTVLITWTHSNDTWAIGNNCFCHHWKEFIVTDNNSQQEEASAIFKWDFQITGLSWVSTTNAFPLTKVPNIREVPKNWKQTPNTPVWRLISKLASSLECLWSFKSFWEKVYHWEWHHNLHVFFQFLIEELYWLLDLTWILWRKRVNIAMCFARYTKTGGNLGEM